MMSKWDFGSIVVGTTCFGALEKFKQKISIDKNEHKEV